MSALKFSGSYMIYIFYILMFSTMLLPHCTNTKNEQASDQFQEPVLAIAEPKLYDLYESSGIILELIKSGKMVDILVDVSDEDQSLAMLLRNFSPAQMAFEAEVLNHKNPVIILFYQESNDDSKVMEKMLEEMAGEYDNQAKFVKIEADLLFALANQACIDTCPSIIVIHNREEIARFVNPSSELLRKNITHLLQDLKGSAV